MSRLWPSAAALLLCFAFYAPALGVQPDEVLADPSLEARARGLSSQLRCMVCQNQSIDDSDAELARDLRLLVRERLVAGDSDAEVLAYLVSRYGEFVLLKPSFSVRNAVLWLAPPIVLVLGGVSVLLLARRRQAATPPALTAQESARLANLLGEKD